MLLFLWGIRYNFFDRRGEAAGLNMNKLWTAPKIGGNAWYQNILTITFKNEPGKPVFIRGSRGYCRNEISPLRALTQPISWRSFPTYSWVEMKSARLGHWHTSALKALYDASMAVEMKSARLGHWHNRILLWRRDVYASCRNEISPLRALTHAHT